MSMDNYPQNADTIEESFVKETCPSFFSIFMDALKDADYELETFAMRVRSGDAEGEMAMDSELDEKQAHHLLTLFDGLCGAFHGKTGLELSLNWHEAMDRGDEVNGEFWTVDGVWQRTPAGEKYKDWIMTKVWNLFG